VTIEVFEPGLLTSVQDAVGRRAWRHLGVPAGGAADPWAARLANRLVGNADAAPVLEMTLLGPTLRCDAPVLVALAGRLEATVDGLPWPAFTSRRVRAGSVVRVADGEDARGYLAVGGGLVVEAVLGSASTDLRTGFGGIDGRALGEGDRLRTVEPGTAVPLRWTGELPTGPIRIVDGPHADRTSPNAITGRAWHVSPRSDRTGVRLDGPPVRAGGDEVPSIGLPAGAIQLPPDGQPIVALADRPVTGGYPVPAVVIGADIGRVARLRPGDELRFASVSLEAARQALRKAEQALEALEVVAGPDDDGPGWAGMPG
jgi:antagonist of KipI